MPPRVLLLDLPTRHSRELEAVLASAGLEVVRPSSPGDALLLFAEGCDVALEELSLGGGRILAAARERLDSPPVILLDDFGTAEDAARARGQGAFEVLARPIPPESVLLTVRRALEQRELRRENLELRKSGASALGVEESRDPGMRQVLATLASVAGSEATLLLCGESGVGKTRLARAVHEASPRSAGPFVAVNCGALPEGLLESELFGHRKGAFTGAVRDRAGKFEAADGGTLFLDEIATASPALQVKLLRVLEQRVFEPVGDERTRSVDVRLIAATNKDLAAEVQAGRFREDLYYRVHVVAVRVPPLRERRADIPFLCEEFLKRFALRHRRAIEGLAPEALAALLLQPWPGNVRELENTLERAVLLTRGPRIAPDDLALAAGSPPKEEFFEDLPLGPLKDALAIPERALILRALRREGGNRQATAQLLGINRTTLFNKMRKYDLLSFPSGPTSPTGRAEPGAARPGNARP